MIELKELLMGIAENTESSGLLISGLALDSRYVISGDLFFALSGTQSDGRRYIGDAIQRGAVAVLVEKNHRAPNGAVEGDAIPVIEIEDLAQKVSAISARFYGAPSQNMTLIGITGTNGKTSCAYFIGQALELLGEKGALIGTLGYGHWNKLQATQHTTPDAITAQKILFELNNDGVRYVAMEVSSHGLQQGRVNACDFDLAVFTNLTHDHLDYHSDFGQYKSVKKQLFLRPELKSSIFNMDDPVGREWCQNIDGHCLGVSRTKGNGEFYCASVRMSALGIELEIHTPHGACNINNKNLFGEFNVENLLSTVAVLTQLGFSMSQIEITVSKLKGVPGRLQGVGDELSSELSGNQPTVFIDYAHTPNGLENVLRSCRKLVSAQAKLICLFGCGGERDREKRPLMGGIAEQFADLVVISADNSRSEKTLDIVEGILAGIGDQARVIVIEDRREAIDYAISQANKEDLVLLAGKGAELTQTLSHGEFAFSDYQCALDVLNKRGLH